MSAFDKLTEIFREFPGIGPRQAKRFVYFLLSREPEFIEKLSRFSGTLKAEIVQCKECFRFFRKNGESVTCKICSDVNRSPAELMVVARDTDLEAIEKSETFEGRYFVLGGTIPLLEAKTREKIRIKELMTRISSGLKSGELKEIILALSVNTEGEFTGDELKKTILPLLRGNDVKISILKFP